MNPSNRPRLIAAALLLACPIAAHAGDLEDCRSTGDIANAARLSACSAVIDAKQVTGADLAVVYTFRGMALSHEMKPDAAISDFTSAIALTPTRWSLYYLRGMAYGSKQDFKAGLADYRAALAHDPPASSADVIRQHIAQLEKKLAP